jgi:hypothetical protein
MKKSQQQPVVMDATGKGDMDATGKGAFLGTLDTSAMEGAAAKNQANLRPMSAGVDMGKKGGPVTQAEEEKEESVNEHLQNLFGGENLSEEFMNKATVVFEAALNERTSAIREQILRESATIIEEEVNKTVNELATRLDEYLSYVVEEWLKDNKLAVENGIRTEIAESFIGGLKNLFETHYIEVPEKKHDVLEDLFNENGQLEEALNEQIKANVELNKEITAGKARAIFLETVTDLSQVDAERLASLAESIDFSSAEDFQNKLTILKENYLKAAPVAAQEPETLTEQRNAPEVNDGPMSVYVNALSRQTKTY